MSFSQYNCSLPKFLGKRFNNWFQHTFGDLCDIHDMDYVLHSDFRIIVDYRFARSIWKRGYRLLAVISFLFVYAFGWLFWFDFNVTIPQKIKRFKDVLMSLYR